MDSKRKKEIKKEKEKIEKISLWCARASFTALFLTLFFLFVVPAKSSDCQQYDNEFGVLDFNVFMNHREYQRLNGAVNELTHQLTYVPDEVKPLIQAELKQMINERESTYTLLKDQKSRLQFLKNELSKCKKNN
jgi:hypothetical protein